MQKALSPQGSLFPQHWRVWGCSKLLQRVESVSGGFLGVGKRKTEYHSLACTQGFWIAALPGICQQHCHHVAILRLQSEHVFHQNGMLLLSLAGQCPPESSDSLSMPLGLCLEVTEQPPACHGAGEGHWSRSHLLPDGQFLCLCLCGNSPPPFPGPPPSTRCEANWEKPGVSFHFEGPGRDT